MRQALDEAKVSLNDLDGIAVTFAPGLIGALLVGVSFAKALAGYVLPFIPGNLIKLALMVLLAKKFRPVIYNYTN